MVFRAERYPANWPEIRAEIRKRAGERCEGTLPDGRRCGAPNGEVINRSRREPWVWRAHHGCSLCLGGDPECRPIRVVLTVAHLDHDERNSDHTNLAALCQRCHLQHDRADNARRAREGRRSRRAAGELPGTRADGEDEDGC